MDSCDVCTLNKSNQNHHSKTAEHKAIDPRGLVYTNFIVSIKPQARGGFSYVIKLADEKTRWNEVYLIKHTSDTSDKLKRFVQNVTCPR